MTLAEAVAGGFKHYARASIALNAEQQKRQGARPQARDGRASSRE